jgi:hypothetical protein
MNGAFMKSLLKRQMKFVAVLVLLVLCPCVTARAQTTSLRGKLQLDDLDRLAPKASDFVNIRMNERLLRLATPMLASNPKDDPEEAAVKDLIKCVKGIYVKSLGFEAEGAYTAKDLTAIRDQLRAPGWEQFVEVRSRRENVNVEVYVLLNGERVEGLAVLSSEPKELTVINIVGNVDMEKLARLQGQFGIPNLELESAPVTQKPTMQRPVTEQKKQP